MKPAPFVYHDPRTIPELLSEVSKYPDAKLLAGGQSLGAMLNFRLLMPEHIIDLNRIPELAFIQVSGSSLRLGSMTRQRALEKSAEVRSLCPVMIEALKHVGHFQTRNRGTIGGSLSHLDPAAELPAISALYDAKLEVASLRGTRMISMSDWCVGYMTPRLEADEVLLNVTLEPWQEPHGHAFIEFSRRRGDFAIAGVACLVALDHARRIKRASITLFGIADTAKRFSDGERLLLGNVLSDRLIAELVANVKSLVTLEDTSASLNYRQHLAGVLLGRAIRQAVSHAEAGVVT